MEHAIPPTLANVVAALGYTPLNKAGDTMLGDLLFTDAIYDIGKSGTTRPRDGFFSRKLEIGTSLAIGGATIGTNAMAVTGTVNISGSANVGGPLTLTSDGRVSGSSGTVMGLTFSDGKVRFTNSSVNAGFTLDGTTDNALAIQNRLGNASATLTALSYRSSVPNGGTAGVWKFGIRAAATVILDTTQYIQLDVDGTLYKLAIAQ